MTDTPETLHPLLARQLDSTRQDTGGYDVHKLQSLVSEAFYDQDRTRRRLERAMALMSEELQEHAEARESLLETLQSRSEQLETTLANMNQGLAMFTDHVLKVINPCLVSMLGYGATTRLEGKSLSEILSNAPNFAQTTDNYASARRLLEEGEKNRERRGRLTARFSAVDDRKYEVELSHSGNGQSILTADDITESLNAEARLKYMAKHDALTGLPNRNYLAEMIRVAETDAERGIHSAILCLDLDQFKAVNDTLGHHVGDLLLKSVAQRLSHCVRGDDVIARLGGDEFAIIQRRISSRADAEQLCDRIIKSICKPYILNDQHVAVGTSIGVALLPENGRNAETLLKQADIALYRAKSDGRRCYRFFEAEMDARLQERRRLEMDLRHAVAAEEFIIRYQPLIDVKNGRITGFEALLRWQHPERGILGPDRFISLAEETGIIEDIGDWTLRTACLEAASWPDDTISIAVNLSAVQFGRPQLISSVESALMLSCLDPRRLELEITESILLENSLATLDQLNQLRALGVKISMDDFGTGYSSLNYLRSFPFDKVKIDKTFLKEGLDENNNFAIVKAVAGLCTELNIETIVEGVEQEDQLKRLSGIEFSAAQGYLFSQPVAEPDVRRMLARQFKSKVA